MCCPQTGGGPQIRPGVSEKSIVSPKWSNSPSLGWCWWTTSLWASISGSSKTRRREFAVDYLTGHSYAVEECEEFAGGAGAEEWFEDRLERFPMARPSGRVSEARVGREGTQAEGREERLPMPFAERGHAEPAVGGLIEPVEGAQTELHAVEVGAARGRCRRPAQQPSMLSAARR